MLETILLTNDKIGENSDGLGNMLVAGLLDQFKNKNISNVILLNKAVLLSHQNSFCFDVLKNLEAKGINIFICQTCINKLSDENSVSVGKITNGEVIAEILSSTTTITLG